MHVLCLLMNLVFVIQEAPGMRFKRVFLFPLLSNSSSLLRRGIIVDPLDLKFREPFGDLHQMLVVNAILRPADKPLVDRRNPLLISKS
jgi:hypothetical protein